MICPSCGACNRDSHKFCECCGASLTAGRVSASNQNSLKLASNTGAVLGRQARELRLNADYSGVETVSVRKYNLIIAAVVLWGILVNVFMCATVRDVFFYINPIVFFVGYLVCCFAGVRIAAKSRNPWVSFLGYNLIVIPFGLLLSSTVRYYLNIDPEIVFRAFVYTALISAGMIGAVLAFPEFFSKLGGMLFGFLIGLFVCEIVLLIFKVRQTMTDWLCAGLFSLYIGYDIYRSQQFAKTVDNAVDCALDIYLDIINLFVRLLSILGKKKD